MSIDNHQLQTYATVAPTIHLQDSSDKLLETIEPMISADIVGYDVILGMPWLQQHNLAMHWSDLLWRKGQDNNDNKAQAQSRLPRVCA